MANELYRTYEVLVEESVHPDHPKRAKDRTKKPDRFNEEIDGALRDTHMIFQDAVCYYTLCLAGLAGNEKQVIGKDRKFVNPLWNYLTTPAPGGIREKTELVIRRLATSYKELEGMKTPEDFLIRIYKWPRENRSDLLPLLQSAYETLDGYGIEYAKSDGEPICIPSKCKSMKNFRNDHFGRLFDAASGKADTTRDKVVVNYFAKVKYKLKPEAIVTSERELADSLDLKSCFKTPKKEKRGLDALYDYLAAFGLPNPGKTPSTIGRMRSTDSESEADRKKFAGYYDQVNVARATMIESFGQYPESPKKDADTKLKAEIRTNQKAWVDNARTKAEDFNLTSFAGNKPNKRLWFCLRYKYHPHPAMRLALYEEIKSLEGTTVDDSNPDAFNAWRAVLKAANGDVSVAPIEPFSKLCLGEAAFDPEFDKSAFVVAAEDLFKYKIRTSERETKIRKLLRVVDAYEEKGETLLDAINSPTGKPVTIRGMKGDPRWKDLDDKKKGILTLLGKLSKGREIQSYGLREGTIGGWSEVRKSLKKVHSKALKEGWGGDESRLVKALEKAVDDEIEENRQGFGSADFFHALCDPDYFHLWLGGAGNEHNGVKDFIPHFVSYCEWREELIDLLIEDDGSSVERGTDMTSAQLKKLSERPISYTWPGLLNRHKKPSYRYYDFTAKLNDSVKMPCLFRRVREERRVVGYERLIGENTKVTLAARRLKRDKIMTLDGKSVDALWCPPLILEGRGKPTTTDAPRAGKYETPKEKSWPAGDIEVSFSLVATPLPGDYWNEVAGIPSESEKKPIHLTVSFKLETETLSMLHQEGFHFVGGSLKGADEEDDKRTFFRWPVDIASDKVAASEADKKAKAQAEKEGRTWSKPTRKADVKPEQLWCHGNDGFTVKEGRYSKKEKTKKVDDLHILGIDLGNRFAAGFARLRIHADKDGDGREISAHGFAPVIKAELVREGTLRLQGEDAKLWQLVSEKNQKHVTRKLQAAGETRDAVIGGYEFVTEKFGNEGRGRFPDLKANEFEAFKALACRLAPEKSISLAGRDKETVPELGDHLIFRLKRRIGRLRTLFNLAWRLCGNKEKDRKGRYSISRKPELQPVHHRMAMEVLARSAFPKRQRQPGEEEDKDDSSLRQRLAPQAHWDEWKPLFESKKGKEEKERVSQLESIARDYDPQKWIDLGSAVKQQIREYYEGADSLDKLLVEVIEFCLPLRGRHWGWDRLRTARLHWDRKDEQHVPKLEGMRGLSMRRLAQILDLRQRCQSFAKLEDRYHKKFAHPTKPDYNPPDSVPRDEVDDVCPLLLERSNRIREQRVNQIANLILAEALGMELTNPARVNQKKERKNLIDLHGEYRRRKIKDKDGKEHDCPRCSVIVLENLERYKTSQERTKAENSRLMKWAHRAIIKKLEDMCRPFGITIMLVDPAFSSHFDSRSGLPGVRVNKVSRGFEQKYPYSKWINDQTKSGSETQLAKDIKILVQQFTEHLEYNGELLLAIEGGKEFLPVNGAIADLRNADITAAVNVGLRAVADPQRWDIFPRLRTKRLSDGDVCVTNWRGWFGKFDLEDGKRRMRAITAYAKAAETESSDEQIPVADKQDEKTRNSKKDRSAIAAANKAVDSQSGQSSEYPPFFVDNPGRDWLPDNDWLKEVAFEFEQDGKKLRAYPQGEYLKRVEQACDQRIKQINKQKIGGY